MKSIKTLTLASVSLAALSLTAAQAQTKPKAPVPTPAAAPATASMVAKPGEWTTVGGDRTLTKYSPLNQITTANVANLKQVWSHAGGGGEITPLYVNNVMYYTTGNTVIALDGVTGKHIWKVDLNKLVVDTGDFANAARLASMPAAGGGRPAPPPAAAVAGEPKYLALGGSTKFGVAYWPGAGKVGPRIVMATRSGYMLQFDAKTGALISDFGKAGLLDLRIGLMEKFAGSEMVPGMVPTIYKNLAIVMPRSGEQGRYGAAGDARAFDLQTGKEVWRFHTVPQPGEENFGTWGLDAWQDRRGPGAWVAMAVDPVNNMVVFGTSNAVDQNYGAMRPGSNLYASSTIAVDGDTGKLKWWFQHTHHDIYDWATSSNPVLADIKDKDGNIVPAVVQPTKSGFMFVLNRLTGKPVLPVEERPVPASDATGEQTWPTQPVPVNPGLTIARQGLTRDEVANLNEKSHEACLAIYDKVNQMGRGTPYSMTPTLVFPSSTGGSTVSGASYDPNTNYIFVNVKDLGTIAMLSPFQSSKMYESLAKSKLAFDDPDGYPCSEPPWGELMAINAATGDVAWKVPLGELPELTAKGIPPTGTDNVGGSTVTAGGVLFIGASQDKTFRAFDARTGKVLWKTTLTTNGGATPLTYLGPDGKQYVTIASARDLTTYALP